MTIDYGFTSSDEVELDKLGLPVGEYDAMAIEEEVSEKISESNPRPVIVTWKVLEGEHKGASAKVWYNIHNANPQTANIAKQNIKRIAEATGRAVSPAAPIKGRVVRLVVDVQKNDDTKTEIKKYMPAQGGGNVASTPADETAPF